MLGVFVPKRETVIQLINGLVYIITSTSENGALESCRRQDCTKISDGFISEPCSCSSEKQHCKCVVQRWFTIGGNVASLV